jgi:hypothetical protein
VSTSSSATTTENISDITESTNVDAMMIGVPKFLTLYDAARESGLSGAEIHARLEDGRLKRRRPVIVSSWDLREEITARKMAGIRTVIASVVEPERVDEVMATQLGLKVEEQGR